MQESTPNTSLPSYPKYRQAFVQKYIVHKYQVQHKEIAAYFFNVF